MSRPTPGIMFTCESCQQQGFIETMTCDEFTISMMMELKEILALEPYVELDPYVLENLVLLPEAVECPGCGHRNLLREEEEDFGDDDYCLN